MKSVAKLLGCVMLMLGLSVSAVWADVEAPAAVMADTGMSSTQLLYLIGSAGLVMSGIIFLILWLTLRKREK